MHIAIVSYTVSTSFACTTSTHRRSTLAIDVSDVGRSRDKYNRRNPEDLPSFLSFLYFRRFRSLVHGNGELIETRFHQVTLALLASIHLPRAAPTTMANYARYGLVIIMLGIVCGQELDALEDVDRNILSLNVPYDSGLVSSSSREIEARVEFEKGSRANSVGCE